MYNMIQQHAVSQVWNLVMKQMNNYNSTKIKSISTCYMSNPTCVCVCVCKNSYWHVKVVIGSTSDP